MNNATRYRRLGLMLLLAIVTMPILAGTARSQSQQRQLKPEIVPIILHTMQVGSIAVSPDGTLVASGSWDSTLKLWDAETGRLLRTFEGHTLPIMALAFSGDGTRLLSGGFDPEIRLWDTVSGELLRTFTGKPIGLVGSLALSSDGTRVLAGLSEGTIWMWDANSGAPIQAFRRHSGPVAAVALSSDGARLLSASKDGTLKLWEVSTGALLRTITVDPDRVYSAAFSRGGERLICGTENGTLTLWDTTDGRLLHAFKGHSKLVTSVALSPDGSRAVSGTRDDGTMKLWDTDSGQLLRTYQEPGITVAISNDSSRVFSGSKTMKRWDATTGRLLRTFEDSSGGILTVAFSPDGSRLLSGNMNNELQVWDATTGHLLRTLRGHQSRVFSAVFSPDGASILSGSGDGTMMLWDLQTGRPLRTFRGHSKGVFSVAFSPDGAYVLSGSDDHTMKLWDAATGRPLRTFGGDIDRVFSVAFSPDGSRVLSGSEDGKMRLWDTNTGQLLRTFPATARIIAVAFSPDGGRVLSGSWEPGSSIRVWDATTGRLLHAFAGQSETLESMALSKDGAQLLAARHGVIELWDVVAAKLSMTFRGHSGVVAAVAFSRDGTRMLSAGMDSTIRIWSRGPQTAGLLASIVTGRDGQWLCITPAGFFAAPDEGAAASNYVSVVRGLRSFSISQFFDELYHPDLVQEALKGDPELKHEDAAARLDLQKIMDSGAPPQIQLIERETDLTTSSVRIAVRLFNNVGGGIGKKLIWRVNGVTQGETTPPELQNPPDPSGPVIVRHGIHLNPNDENLISVTAYNGADRFATEPLLIRVDKFGVSPGPRAKMYVLGIAVDRYGAGSGLAPLQFAAKDARALVTAFNVAGKNGGYEDVVAATLIDQDAVPGKIAEAFAHLQSLVNPWDTFVLILAGHGRSVAGRGYFYYPQNAMLGNGHTVLTDGINADQWRDWLAMVETTKRLLIIDTCESAEAIAIERGNSLERESAIDRIRQAVGHSVITASRQIAYEGSAYGHGVLSYAILEALGTPQPNDAIIDVKGIDNYVVAEVPKISSRLSGIEQKPYDKIVGNFPVGRPSQSVRPSPPSQCAATAKTSFFLRRETIRKSPRSDAEANRIEDVGYTVTVAEYTGGWASICREGIPIGYVPMDALHESR